MTPTFRLSYPTLVVPEKFKDPQTGQEKGEPVYNMEMIFDAEQLAAFNAENTDTGEWDLVDVRKVGVMLAKQKWSTAEAPFNPAEAVKHGGLGWPFKSGDERAAEKGGKADHLKGKMLVRAKALSQINGKPNSPRLYYADPEGGPDKQIVRGSETAKEQAAAMFYGGAYCAAELSVVASEFANKKYITIYINSVVFLEHGERLGSGSAMERFRGTRGGQSDYDPTEGMGGELEDEIPF
jgi:hypothetical protein